MPSALENAQTDATIFFQQLTAVKSYSQSKFNKNGQVYAIYSETADPNLTAKTAGVHGAVDALIAKGVALPKDMRFYLNNAYGTQNRAYHFDMLGKSVSWLSLGSSAVAGASGRGISAQSTPGFDSATKVAIHEIGHSLHAANVGLDDFLKPKSQGNRFGGACPACSSELSQYAGDSKKEFVAEAFTAQIIGKQVSDQVLQEYRNLGGPPIGWTSSSASTGRPRSNAVLGRHRG